LFSLHPRAETLAMSELDRHPDTTELEALLDSNEAATVVEAIIGFTPSGAVITAADGKVLRVSDYTARLVGRPRSELEDLPLSEALARIPAYDAEGRRIPYDERPTTRALRGEVVTGFECLIETVSGERIPCNCNAEPIFNWNGELIGSITSHADVRSYKAMEQHLREVAAQREALYRELTHRVKNHLQIMSGVVALQARRPALSARDLADQLKGQIQALAAVYRSMDVEGAMNGARVEARSFIEEVCRPYSSEEVKVEVAVAPDNLALGSEQAGPIGMLVNEAVCNSVKHAFPDHHGHVHVKLRRLEPGHLRLEIDDDGVGLSAADPSDMHSGFSLMRLLAKQLHSELELSENRPRGARIAAELPERLM
jgi:two-component sensor histidine kinase